MGEVVTVHLGQEPPASWDASCYLAGPTSRTETTSSWRFEALTEIRKLWTGTGNLIVFVPELAAGDTLPDYDDIRQWQLYWGDRCDLVVFWIARSAELPGLTTNDEWGRWKDSGRVVLGAPDEKNVRYQRNYARDHRIPMTETLEKTIAVAMDFFGVGATRADGHRQVPLHIWRTASFQQWLYAQENAGNKLLGARQEWVLHRDKQKDHLMFWVLHVTIYIALEDRIKNNEVILSRPDISSVLAYRRADCLADTEIVLVREFRSTSGSSDGFVRELPGGSSITLGNPKAVAAAEFEEETGLAIDPDRLQTHSSRQLSATLSVHRQHLFSVELSTMEIESIRLSTGHFGVAADTEQTYPEVYRVRDLIGSADADWTTLGTITEVLLGEDYAG